MGGVGNGEGGQVETTVLEQQHIFLKRTKRERKGEKH